MIFSNWIFLVSVALLLVALKALFIATEFSLIKLRYSHFNPDLLEELQKSRRFAGLPGKMDQTLRFIRLGALFFTLALGQVLVPLVEQLALSFGYEPGSAGKWALFCVSFLIALAVQYVIGHLVPRGVALQHPVGSLKATAWFIWFFGILFAPLLKLLDFFSKQMLRLFRMDPYVSINRLDLEEQIQKLDEESEIPEFTQQVFKNVISMRDLVVQDVMLPRNQIQYFDVSDSNHDNVKLSKKTGHTRFPLCEGDLDNCIGIMHIKDIYSSDEEVRRMDFKKLARPVIYVGPDDPLDTVLEKLLEMQLHMALVRDEFGGTVGVVTMENIVEELVGNIQDEFDSEAEQIEEVEEDELIVDGLTPIHDVEEKLDTHIEEEEVSTIGGLITAELGKIPEVGQKVRLKNLEFEAIEVDEKRVLSARVRVIPGMSNLD